MRLDKSFKFQSTYPRRVRHFRIIVDFHLSRFQSTYPRRVRRIRCCDSMEIKDNFNPRTHEGYDLVCSPRPYFNIFQSTYPRRVRLDNIVLKAVPACISIHVPTKGTTVLLLCCKGGELFQSTYPRRVRPGMSGTNLLRVIFQSTYPRRVRLLATPPILNSVSISIHVPTKGTTSCFICTFIFIAISIHVPTKGTTDTRSQLFDCVLISIHVPTKGTTLIKMLQQEIIRISIHVPTKGTTQQHRHAFCNNDYFNPRTHEGYDSKNIQ